MKVAHLIATGLALLLFNATVEAKTPRECIEEGGGDTPAAVAIACLDGKDYKMDNINGHGFHSKPVNIARAGSRVTINGQLSHMLNLRPDDQIFYRVVKDGNKIESLEMKIDEGGFAVIAGPVVSAVAAYLGVPVEPSKITEIGHIAGRAAEGQGWKATAEAIIINIALRAN